eukprot:GHVR01163494.1.p1 GENE.GHVR01163494.1~~GHVR01163494.1.p1  ORF type:complete len:100 (-),score=8.50 GHVR01163494.1:173-472(-)
MVRPPTVPQPPLTESLCVKPVREGESTVVMTRSSMSDQRTSVTYDDVASRPHVDQSISVIRREIPTATVLSKPVMVSKPSRPVSPVPALDFSRLVRPFD